MQLRMLMLQVINDEPVFNRAQCFQGELFNCTAADVCPNSIGQTIPRVWQNAYYNFDNVGNGMLTLFVVATIDNPMDIIGYQTMDSTGEGLLLNSLEAEAQQLHDPPSCGSLIMSQSC